MAVARGTFPEPDPIGVVYFAGADSVFALAEDLTAPYVFASRALRTPTISTISRRVPAYLPAPSHACLCCPGTLPLGLWALSSSATAKWRTEELNALQTIATLFAQLQARIAAEEQVRYLAEHDDLTGLLNRRALITHLDDRLGCGPARPSIGTVT